MPVLVFVHSPLVGPSTWRAVAHRLDRAGHRGVVVDLSGVRPDLAALADAVADQVRSSTVDLIEGSTVDPAVGPTGSYRDDAIVLIGHSGAGPVLPLAAARLDGVVELVYVDAALPRPGLSWVDTVPEELAAHLRSMVDADGYLPPWTDWFPGQTVADLLPAPGAYEAFAAEVPRLPWTFFTDPAPPGDWDGPASYLRLSEGYQEESDHLDRAGQPVTVLDRHHLAPLSDPDGVADALLDLLPPPPQALVFGAHAPSYEARRPGYPDELVDAALAYAGHPDRVVEVGAGTGKATRPLARRVARLTCLEPDPAMAAQLRTAVGAGVEIVATTFERWQPPAGGVPMLVFALSWHWTDATRRLRLAHEALAPRGVLAVLDHGHGFADQDLADRIHAQYDRIAPQLGPRRLTPTVIDQHAGELAASGWYDDITTHQVVADVAHPTAAYLELLGTFSNHIGLAPARRRRLHAAIAAEIDAAGGTIVVRRTTTLVLARSVAGP